VENPPEGDALVGLAGEERAVERGEREARELVGGWAVRVISEGDCDLVPQALECLSADAADDSLYFFPGRGWRLRGHGHEQAQEVGVPLEGAARGCDHRGQVRCGGPGSVVPGRELGEEAIGAALHDGEQDFSLEPK
jgi:hypothetical protein